MDAGNGVVLVVDDEPDIGELLRMQLEQLDAEVVVVTTAEEAVAAIDGGLDPRLVIMDLWLPGTNGREAIGALRDKGMTGDVIAFSAHYGAESATFPQEWNVVPVDKGDLRTFRQICRLLLTV